MSKHKITIQRSDKAHSVTAAPARVCGQVRPSLLAVMVNGQSAHVLLSHEPYDGSFFCRQLNQRFADFKAAAAALLDWLFPEPPPVAVEPAPEPAATPGWTADKMTSLLEKNDRAVRRALLLIYKSQDERQKAGHSSGTNTGRGFSRYDRSAGNHLAQLVSSGQLWSDHQLNKGRKLAIKYRRQLVDIANKKGGR